jgi:CBS domain-containing protein
MGGLVIGVGGYFQPRALGVGYDVINDLLSGSLSQNEIMALLLVKAVIWLVALASGTSGGVLAPLLIFGCALGEVQSHWFFGATNDHTWALISMGAVLGGMMRSPFMAIMFCFELTHDVDSLLPLLIAAVSSYTVTVLAMKRSILTEKISRRGFDIFREYSVDPLERLQIKEVMTRELQTVRAEMPAAELLDQKFVRGKHRGYPVLADTPEGAQKLIGVIVRSDLEKVPGLDDLKNLTARDLIQKTPITIFDDDTCKMAADRMATADIGRLLVINAEGRLIGMITRSDLLKARQVHINEEAVRERIMSSPIRFNN